MDANFGYPVDSDTAPCSASAETDIEKDLYDQICKILGKEGISFSKQSTAAAAPAVCSNNEKYERIRAMMDATECFGNDIDEVDMIARRCAQIYCYEVEKYRNPRGGQFQAGIYPVSANVLFGKDVGALPDGRLAKKPLADGCSPRAGKDVKGPTAAAASVAKLDHEVASNGTLYNQKFLPSAVAGDQGLMNFASVIRSYFDKKGMHVQFNVVDKETLLDAQAHPENYKDLVVRVAGYSAMFTELAKEVQDDIISRTEQHF
jgi:pyruvate-formate lyase